jgi:hypothetical protein
MLYTYKATLRGDHLEWNGSPPEQITRKEAVTVHVTILDEGGTPAVDAERGRRMAETLEQLAAIRAMADITDPAAWEREQRQDRD